MAQTWTIKGQTYTHAQLQELKRQGLNPHKDDIVMKFISKGALNSQEEATPEVVEDAASEGLGVPEPGAEDSQAPAPGVPATVIVAEMEKEEFDKMKAEKAWTNPAKKERYNELKAKFTKS